MVGALTLAVSLAAFGTARAQVPQGWGFHNPSGGYEAGRFFRLAGEPTGKTRMALRPKTTEPFEPNTGRFGILYHTFDAAKYRGKRVSFSATLLYHGVETYASAWLRADRERGSSTWYDAEKGDPLVHLSKRLDGDGDQGVRLVQDVPAKAETITIGFSLYGNGVLAFDELRFDVVDETVPVTASTLLEAPDLEFKTASAAWERKDPLDERVTVKVRDVSLTRFLDAVSQQARVNFIVGEGLAERRVSADLRNVTVRELLDIVASLKGLSWTRIARSNTYMVTRKEKRDSDIDAMALELKTLREELAALRGQLKALSPPAR